MAALINTLFEQLGVPDTDCTEHGSVPKKLVKVLILFMCLQEDEAFKTITMFLREKEQAEYNFEKLVEYLLERGHKEPFVRHCFFLDAFQFIVKGTDILKIPERLSDDQLTEAQGKLQWGLSEEEQKILNGYFLKDFGMSEKARRDIETVKISE
jgi:hypothetical protein